MNEQEREEDRIKTEAKLNEPLEFYDYDTESYFYLPSLNYVANNGGFKKLLMGRKRFASVSAEREQLRYNFLEYLINVNNT